MSIPLQFGGVPGGVELLIIILVFLVVFVLFGLVVPLGVGYWIYRDATRHDNDDAVLWAAGTAALFYAGVIPGVIALGAYLYTRKQEESV